MSLPLWVLIPILSLTVASASWAEQVADLSKGRRLIVGTKQAPPFSIKSEDGTWKGISIELWEEIASELDLAYELREHDLKRLLDDVEKGNLDVAVAALTITADREQRIDFTHPFHTSGLGIAVIPKGGRNWIRVMERFLSIRFLKIIAGLGLVLLAFGMLVWFFERKRNPEQFGGKTASGIGNAFWWSAVTMTTVGYGDKAPKTMGGRVISIIWMFTGIIVISSFTAAITSALTVSQLESGIKGPEDLPKVKVGTVSDSTSEAYLQEHGIQYKEYPTPGEGLNAVVTSEIEALVYDAPILRYFVNREFQGKVSVLVRTFERQDYGIALPPNSRLREPINKVLLDKISAPEWDDTLIRYLGN